MKVKKVEIDTNTVRVQKKDGKITSWKMQDVLKIRVDYLYLSMYPALGVAAKLSKKAILNQYTDYDIVIRSKKISGITFLGIVKRVTYKNICTFMKNHQIKAKHIFLTPFTLFQFRDESSGRQLIVYKGDSMIHLVSFENGLPLFATSYLSFDQLDEFISEFYEDGNAVFTLLSNSPIDYDPPFEFKNTKKIVREGIILNAIS